MKKWLLVVFLCYSFSALASGLHLKKDDGELVYTNISRNLFFARAFKYSCGNKRRVIHLIETMAKRYGVDEKLVKAIARIESDYNPKVLSEKGAKGVMQLMDKTAKSYGVYNPYDVKENIKGGVLFLKHLIKKYHGNARLVAAAYNAGETAVDRYKGVPPYPETMHYVRKFEQLYCRKKIPYKSIKKTYNRIVEKNGVYSNVVDSLW